VIRQSLAGRCILIVEDEPLVALHIIDAVKRAGAIVRVTYSLVEAAVLVEADDLSAAILDYRVGDGDSSLLCQRLRERGCALLDLQRLHRVLRGLQGCTTPAEADHRRHAGRGTGRIAGAVPVKRASRQRPRSSCHGSAAQPTSAVIPCRQRSAPASASRSSVYRRSRPAFPARCCVALSSAGTGGSGPWSPLP
jgi:CheY-like chemotaxis protein